MKIAKNLICISMVAMLSISSVSVAYADNSQSITVKKEKPVQVSSAVQNRAGSLLKKNEVPSESIKVRESLPAKYSSAEKGYVSSIKNQGSHNTCWTFATMALMETALIKNGYGTYDFSEEHLDSWGTKRSDNTGWLRQLNSGGYSDTAMGYLASWQGPRLESDIPFGYATGKTSETVNALGTTEYGATDIVRLPNDRNTIKTAVYEYGAVSASFAANDIFFNEGETAAFAYKVFSNPANIEGHAITIVGWDDNYSKSNFKAGCQPSRNGAWLCKNSWGDYNSLGGYFWISYEDPYLFGEDLSEPFAVAGVQEITDNIKLYQVEEFGSTYDFNLTVTSNGVSQEVTDMTYINKFDFTDEYPNLDGVMFETKSVGADYSIYYIPVASNGQPVSNENKWVELADGVVDYCGYITVDTDFELPSGKGAIGVKIDGTDSNVASTLGCDEWLVDGSNRLVFRPKVNKDASYIVFNSDMYNLSDFYLNFLGDSVGSNFVIKAIASAEESYNKFDINNDSRIDVIDITLMQRYLLGESEFDSNQIYAADLDSNGEVTLVDMTLMVREILG